MRGPDRRVDDGTWALTEPGLAKRRERQDQQRERTHQTVILETTGALGIGIGTRHRHRQKP